MISTADQIVTHQGTTLIVKIRSHEPNNALYPSGFRNRYHFLSNFSESAITVPMLRRFPAWMRGKPARTVENAFQAAKFPEPPSPELLREFKLNPDDPLSLLSCFATTAKRMGRYAPYDGQWDVRSLDVMESLLEQKFNDADLLAWLRATGSMTLIEWNDRSDKRWGVTTWDKSGSNLLGQLLMAIRLRRAA